MEGLTTIWDSDRMRGDYGNNEEGEREEVWAPLLTMHRGGDQGRRTGCYTRRRQAIGTRSHDTADESRFWETIDL